MTSSRNVPPRLKVGGDSGGCGASGSRHWLRYWRRCRRKRSRGPDRQDVENQKHGILEYCNDHNISGLEFVRDAASGKVKWRDRKIGGLLTELCQPGDTVVFAEISRMARSTLQVLEILEYCAQHQINVHIAKQRMVLDDSMQSRITATVLGLAAEIEREFISLRTKEALAKRKQDGHTLGRPKGKAETVKLDVRDAEILGYLEKQVSKRAIAKIIGCAPSTLYEWIERRGFNKYKRARGRQKPSRLPKLSPGLG